MFCASSLFSLRPRRAIFPVPERGDEIKTRLCIKVSVFRRLTARKPARPADRVRGTHFAVQLQYELRRFAVLLPEYETKRRIYLRICIKHERATASRYASHYIPVKYFTRDKIVSVFLSGVCARAAVGPR